MRALLVILTFLSLQSVFALEIDEKLTLRLLKISNSKKTILINRGAEDGLVVGDHAKFFVTTGVIARGVVEKVSPSRSVWSLYRIVDPNELSEAKVLNLKIASPVKITEDPSKSVSEEVNPAGTEKMGLSEGSVDGEKTAESTEAEDKEFEEMGIEDKGKPAQTEINPKSVKPKSMKSEENVPVHSGVNTSKTWELWGTLYMSSLSGTVESDTTSATSMSESSVDLSAGVEKYFLNLEGLLKETSVTIFLRKKSLEPGGSEKLTTGTDKITIDSMEFGGGVNYHFYNSAASTNTLIGFGGINFGAGSGTISSSTFDSISQSNILNNLQMTNSFFSLGAGLKYTLSNGFGIRALFDFYKTNQTLTNTTENDSISKSSLAGTRMHFGISYRF